MASSGSVEVLSPKKAGSRVEGNVVQRVSALEIVPDREARWCDARATAPITPSPELPFVGLDRLDASAPVEIKAAQLVLGSGCAGRIYIRQGQHEDHVLSKDVAYLVAVYDPRRSCRIVAMVVVAADFLDHVKPDGWITVEADRSEDGYRQLAWTNFFDADLVGDPFVSSADALHDVLDDRRVYLPSSTSPPSEHYHADASCAARGRGSACEALLERAAKEGFEPCSTCATGVKFALAMEDVAAGGELA
jgi:hypothetical protein